MQEPKMWGDKPYRSLDYMLKQSYGEKVYKLALNGGMTCPNRDGRVGTGGCIFCSAGGSGDFAADAKCSVTEQIRQQKEAILQKKAARKYIAYFQAYTNTYAPVEYLEKIYTEAISDEDVVILSIATRPDCLPEETLDLLGRLNQEKPVWVELGLQTVHEETAKFLRRGYELPCFERAVKELRKRGITVIVHTILGLPGEDEAAMLQTIEYLNHQDIQGIKLQLLHILKDTRLGELYLRQISEKIERTTTAEGNSDAEEKKTAEEKDAAEAETVEKTSVKTDTVCTEIPQEPFRERAQTKTSTEERMIRVLTEDEYVAIVLKCVAHLDPDITIHRLTGDGPKDLLLAPLWSCRKRTVLNHIHQSMKEQNVWQGRDAQKGK